MSQGPDWEKAKGQAEVRSVFARIPLEANYRCSVLTTSLR